MKLARDVKNMKRGHAALQTWIFSEIKDRGTIDCQLDGKTVNIKKNHLRILTPDEEHSTPDEEHNLRTKTDVTKVYQGRKLVI